ncbi:C2H2-type zinc finger containing protein, putative [Angomonas deanei]|uniref:C2H2-type zinc finger containing protein, putative n=1 Tax=Angomonas deanei TaxID=59799 RepID=A0A7G2C624_9TRYP|nr:C2H2-type zinc finger containing protein, putative [Angomonas deanei]
MRRAVRRVTLLAIPQLHRRALTTSVGRKTCSDMVASVPPLYSSLCQPKRWQSSATDKKFHCSLCGKSFRLEMAAKVHLQQAHNGEGTVEAGAGVPVEEPKATPEPSVSTAPPSTAPSPFKRRERTRAAPAPLYKPDETLPADALEELLGVWDKVGTARLGDTFVHSSMVMKVFAVKPGDQVSVVTGRVSSAGSGGSDTPQPTVEAATAAGSRVVSPFSAEEVKSPFAGQVNSPFLEAAQSAPQAMAPSPFLDPSMSPFLGTTGTPSFPSYDSATPTGPLPSEVEAVGMTGLPAAEASFACSQCDKRFTSYEGLRMHSKAKHNMEMEKDKTAKHNKPHKVPPLPAFIPSPVDISLTKPLDASSATLNNSWIDTEITLHGCAINNTLLSGVVALVETYDKYTTQVFVVVKDDEIGGEAETLVLRCRGACQEVAASLKRDDVVFASGTLRLLTSKDDEERVTPVIMVSMPFGVLMKVT